jgi:PAS domain S-box-containing protein
MYDMIYEKQQVTRFRLGILQVGLVSVVLYFISRYDFLLFHALAEFIGASIGVAIFLLAWNSRAFSKNNFFLFIGTGLATVSILSIIHSLAYKGMGVFPFATFDSNVATQLWLAGEFVLAGTFVAAPLILKKRIHTSTIFLIFLTTLTFLILSIFLWKIFPTSYIEGSGQTTFKKISEYAVAILFIFSAYLFWINRRSMDKRMLNLLSFSLLFFFLSTLSFTHYVSVYDFFNMLGHQFRIVAFYGGYLGIVEIGLMRPYNSLFREVKDREESLKKAKSEWERTFDSVPDLVAILDKNHQIVRANKAMAERLGTTAEKCIGAKCYRAVHKCDKPIKDCPHAKSLLDGKEHISEVHEPNLGGYFIVSTTPLKDEKGEMMGCVHVARDITERKKAEKIMEDLARFPLENPSPVMRISLDGKIIYANPASDILLNEFHIRKGDAIPENWNKIVKFAIMEKSSKSFEAGPSNNKFLITIAPVINAPYANIYSTNITKRKNAEIALNNEKEKLKQVLDRMEDGVYIVDREYKISYINPSFEKILGLNLEKKKCFEYLHGFKSPCIWCRNEEVFSGKSVHWECYFRRIKKTFDIIETPIINPEGVPMKLQILRDITEKKKMEKAKDDFISLASHQLRTPLSAISLSSELLLRGISGDVSQEQKEYIEEIHKAAKRMTLLVSNFLNVSRLEMGTFSVDNEPLDVLSAIENKLKYFSPIISEKKLEFEKKIETEIPPVLFNVNSFDIVFDNLLSNAIRYTPAEGRISLSLKKNDNAIVLKVSDTGCGIPDNLEEKVFEKSFRSENAQKISSEGAGLGLYMVRSIADLTGSKVWYESTEEKGTSFYFSIPIK